MASFFRGSIYAATAMTGLLWSALLCIYSMLICPFLAGMQAPVLFCLYTTSIAAALCIQPAIHQAITNRTRQYSSTIRFGLQLFSWITLGAGLALFNYLAFDLPSGSGEKVILGFGFLGVYSSISHLLKQPLPPLKPKQLQRYRNLLVSGIYCLPVILAGITIWIIATQLSVNWSGHQLPARSLEQIMLNSVLFMLLIALLISQSLFQLGFSMLNTQAQQWLANIDQRSHQLNPAHNCEFKCIRQPKVQILNNPAYQQKIIHRLRTLKYQDPVTGTHNTRFVKDFLHSRWQKEPTLQLPFLLIQIKATHSIDKLSCRCDSDELQSEVARRIHQFLMPEDILARLDNNCFAVIPANPDLLVERTITQHLNQNLQKEPLLHYSHSGYIQCKISRENFLSSATSSKFLYAIPG
ncbi:GGDEF domain-containing protein [Aliamphritea ceti]|uniref:GGDEF domain-containing protein n=1 Tax=Aliamphritea ceti TaxID=1524258 RepID=UPI0021C40795|nr:GGDEF domain-containing protein [Aliamphritea ceti]